MMVRLSKLLLLAEDIWKKALARLDPATDKSNITSAKNPASKPPAPVPAPASEVPTTTATTTATTTTSPKTAPSATTTKKRCWRRRTVHFTVFLAVFSTILSLLWVYTLTAELRRQAFDANMTKEYVLSHVSMDNPQLVKYMRDFQLKPTTGHEPLNSTQSPEEEFVANHLQGKRGGVYFEYMSRAGASSTTGWLESSLNWHGLMVFTDPRNDAYRSKRNHRTRVLQACLSTDKDTRVITYHQEADVQVTKLGEGPNSLGPSKASLPATRLICFPLYSILLAYNATVLDYVSLDSTEIQDGLVLDPIPWDIIRISVLTIHWSPHHTDAETKSVIDKLASHNYKHVKSLVTGKLVFLYNNSRLKI